MAPKRKATEIPKDLDNVMKPVRGLKRQVEVQYLTERPSPSQLGYHGLFEVAEHTPDAVRGRIEGMIVQVVSSIMRGVGFGFTLPSRTGTLKFISELDTVFLEYREMKRTYGDVSQVKKTAMMCRVLQIIREICIKNIHVTKRDLFYSDVKLFEKQGASDGVIEEVACLLKCTRNSLHVTASEKGVVVGKIQFTDDDDIIDCTKMGVSGKNVPTHLDRVTDIRSDYDVPAEFILLVEKDAAFMRLAEDRFYNKYPCIIMTGKGEADLATRMFLKRVKEQLKIPILGLFDSDAHGLKILSVYMQGSEAMSHDAGHLATPDIKWLGVRPSDLNKYKIPQQCRLELTPGDISFGTQLLEKPYIQKRKEWVKELELMLKTKEKAEIQALSSFGFQYLSEEYLPRKLKEGDWV